jgi:hypothetical protein
MAPCFRDRLPDTIPQPAKLHAAFCSQNGKRLYQATSITGSVSYCQKLRAGDLESGGVLQDFVVEQFSFENKTDLLWPLSRRQRRLAD